MHLLLIEDDLDLGQALLQALRTGGFTCEWLRSAADARRTIQTVQHTARQTPQQSEQQGLVYQCVLLDLTLPDGYGLQLLREWRAAGLRTPLIIITASDALGERLSGLDDGADDFLVKPFAMPELIARVHAVTRRAAQQAASLWTLGDLTVDVPRRECRVAGELVALSPREFDIVVVLARASGHVVAKHRLAQALAPLGEPVDFNAIEVHMHNLRNKVGNGRVRTVRGVGYQWVAQAGQTG
jgi:two-component system, OmpR family, response regulator QseB